jgi:hypothetical protein
MMNDRAGWNGWDDYWIISIDDESVFTSYILIEQRNLNATDALILCSVLDVDRNLAALLDEEERCWLQYFVPAETKPIYGKSLDENQDSFLL